MGAQDEAITAQTNGSKWVLDGLRSLWHEERLCDMALVVEEERFKCHQAVLSAASPQFRQYAEQQVKERRENGNSDEAMDRLDVPQPVEIELQAVSHPEAVKVMLEHIYCDDAVPTSLSDDALKDVISLAIAFQLPALKEYASSRLTEGVTASNMVRRLLTCNDLDLPETREQLCDQIVSKANLLAKANDSDELLEHPELLQELYRRESIGEGMSPKSDDNDEEDDGAETLENCSRKMRRAKFNDSEVPPSEDTNLSVQPENKKFFDKLVRVLEDRPIWLQGMLEEKMQCSFEDGKYASMLAHVAYQWADGPWAGTYTKLGYDPREDTDAKWYQVIKFSDPAIKKLAANDKVQKALEKLGADHTFRRPPFAKTQTYQLTDIKDDFVRGVLQGDEVSDGCDKKTGYFSNCTLDSVNSRLIILATQLRDKHALKMSNDRKRVLPTAVRARLKIQRVA